MHIIAKKNIIETINVFVTAYKHVPIRDDVADMHISKKIQTKHGVIYIHVEFYIKNKTRYMDISLLISVDNNSYSFKNKGMLMYKKDLTGFINDIDNVIHSELYDV